MCMADWEYGQSEFYRVSFPVARKDHTCQECGRKIAFGEKYHAAAGKSEGTMWTAKVCVHCQVAAGWLAKNCGGYLYHAIIEDIGNHAEGNISMLRIVVGARRKWRSFADPGRLLPIPSMPPDINENHVH